MSETETAKPQRMAEIVSDGSAWRTQVLLADGTDLCRAMNVQGVDMHVDAKSGLVSARIKVLSGAKAKACITFDSCRDILAVLLADEELAKEAAAILAARGAVTHKEAT